MSRPVFRRLFKLQNVTPGRDDGGMTTAEWQELARFAVRIDI